MFPLLVAITKHALPLLTDIAIMCDKIDSLCITVCNQVDSAGHNLANTVLALLVTTLNRGHPP